MQRARTINATNYGSAVAGRVVEQLSPAIAAAKTAGAVRLVITSWQDLDNSPQSFVDGFRTVEKHARDAFPDATVLRLTYGMTASVARDVHWARAAGVLTAPAGTARIAPAASEDLAAATANVVLAPTGKTHDLTGPDTIDWNDLASLAGVEYQPVSDREFSA
jgi:uncharacterized protein YbjT (DUF2867 family)